MNTTVVNEEWRPVVGWEGLYEVSDRGHVRRVGGRVLRHNLSGRTREHRSVQLCREGVPTRRYVHRLVAEVFLGPSPFEGAEVRHIRGASQGDAVDNIIWGTHAENMADMATTGSSCHGERRPNAVLTDDIVRAIRVSSEPIAVLASRYGVAQSRISKVRRGHIWKHVA